METTWKVEPRRRRKRPRPRPSKPCDETKHPPYSIKVGSKSIPNLDDRELTFLDCDGDFVTDGHAVLRSVPNLLKERSLGGSFGRQSTWQQRALKKHVKKPPPDCPRRQWRSYCKRSIPFTQLGTPHSEAVLAMDRTGSFVLCLGANDIRGVPLALAIRFFGIPSPAAMGSPRGFIAPLLQTTPLLYEIEDESAEDAIFNFRREVSPACTPVKIIISKDWRMGVALFQPSIVWGEEGPMGTLVLFSTPRGHRHDFSRVTTWQCTNVKMWAGTRFSYRNLLWQVDGVPVPAEGIGNDSDNVRVHRVPATLFLNDEEDGFRLTWASEHNLGNMGDECVCDEDMTQSTPLVASVNPSFRILTFETTWERLDSDGLNGARILPVVNDPVGVCVLSEGYLHIEVLLRDILSKRKGMAEQKPSEFFYNLVSVTNGGRVAELIITFIRTTRPGSLGLFVKVDLYAGQYEEGNWVKNVHAQHPSTLRQWCNALALNQRMKSLRVGPYAVKLDQMMDWSRLCTEMERGFDPDEVDDFSPCIWEEYVEGEEAIATRKLPKLVSHSTLYPDCDFVTNKAITDFNPAISLQGKCSPTELVYS